MTLRNQCNNTVQAKQTMAAMGWEFDPNKNRKEQVQGTYLVFTYFKQRYTYRVLQTIQM
jgi:hypothetical protein